MRELSSDLKVILKKFNVYIKGIAGMLLKRKSMFFYGFEVREIRRLPFLDSPKYHREFSASAWKPVYCSGVGEKWCGYRSKA